MNYQWNIIGHQKQVSYLQKSIKNGKINQAYLFLGPAHVGKGKIAESFIYTIFCLSQTKKRPCGRCQNCSQIKKNIHPDVFWLSPETDKKNISVNQVRQLIKKLQQKTSSGGYKMAIIKEADKLSLAASNALLKTLEEPAPRTSLILLAEEISTLPKTIISRCQVIKFLPVSQKEIYDQLISQGTAREQAQIFSQLAQNCPGLALNYASQKNAYQKYQEKLNLIKKLYSPSTTKTLFRDWEKIIQQKNTPAQLHEWLGLAVAYGRDLLLAKNSLFIYTVNSVNQDPPIKIEEVQRRLKLLQRSQEMLALNGQPKLILEDLLINI